MKLQSMISTAAVLRHGHFEGRSMAASVLWGDRRHAGVGRSCQCSLLISKLVLGSTLAAGRLPIPSWSLRIRRRSDWLDLIIVSRGTLMFGGQSGNELLILRSGT